MSCILALDIGDVRIGVAIANTVARLPRPLATLSNDDSFASELQEIITSETVTIVVVGYPRDVNGNETEQTRHTAAFIQNLAKTITPPIVQQDEALTSNQAEQELLATGKNYTKGDIDALAACYILQDYLDGNPT